MRRKPDSKKEEREHRRKLWEFIDHRQSICQKPEQYAEGLKPDFIGNGSRDTHGVIAYHGTDIPRFLFTRDSEGGAGVGLHLTSSPIAAMEYAMSGADTVTDCAGVDEHRPRVIPVRILCRNMFIATTAEIQRVTVETRDMLELFGFDGMVAKYPDGTAEFVVFDPGLVQFSDAVYCVSKKASTP